MGCSLIGSSVLKSCTFDLIGLVPRPKKVSRVSEGLVGILVLLALQESEAHLVCQDLVALASMERRVAREGQEALESLDHLVGSA